MSRSLRPIPDTVYLTGCPECGWSDLLFGTLPLDLGKCWLGCKSAHPIVLKATYKRDKKVHYRPNDVERPDE